MAKNWNPADSGDGGLCYRTLVAETKAAIAAARSKHITLRLRAFAWIQGESDANTADAPYYEKALGDMIAALRKDLYSPKLTALLAVNTKFGGGANSFISKIVEAQQAVASKDFYSTYVDTSSSSVVNPLHFDSAGTLDVGHRLADALLRIEANGRLFASASPGKGRR